MLKTAMERIGDELERYAYNNGGVYWLPYVDHLGQEPKEPVWVIVDFPDRGEYSALLWADRTFSKNGILCHATAIGDFSKDDLLRILAQPLVLGKLIGPLQTSSNLMRAITAFGSFLQPMLSYRCSDAWIQLVVDFLATVRELLPSGQTFVLTMVGRRNGALNLRWASSLDKNSAAEEAIWAANARAVFRSRENCETCGQPGVMRMTEETECFVACDEHSGGSEKLEMPPVLVLGDRTFRCGEVSNG